MSSDSTDRPGPDRDQAQRRVQRTQAQLQAVEAAQAEADRRYHEITADLKAQARHEHRYRGMEL